MIFVDLNNGYNRRSLYHNGLGNPVPSIIEEPYDGPVIGPLIAVKYGRASMLLRTESFDITLAVLEDTKVDFFGVYDNVDIVQTVPYRYNETVEVFNTPDRDLPLLINSKSKWIRNYVEWRLRDWSLEEERVHMKYLKPTKLSENNHLIDIYVYSRMLLSKYRGTLPRDSFI